MVAAETSDVPAPDGAAIYLPAVFQRATPEQQIFFYDDVEWERFVREWATAKAEYAQVKRIGGPNDRGADVAGFRTIEGFDGPWDCYQCKHYAQPLGWADLLPELIKIFRGVLAKAFTMPERYIVLAPKGPSSSLNRLMSTPHELKAKFLDDAPGRLDEEATRSGVVALAEADAFTRFVFAQPEDVIAEHRATRYFAARFGQALPARGVNQDVPDDVEAQESRYIAQLMAVYEERHGVRTVQEAREDERLSRNFALQRMRFFAAESLRRYAVDGVPPGTFERLVDDIHAGVVDVAEMDHESGWQRMHAVLGAAGRLSLDSQILMQVANQNDLKGVCHHLANDDRLTWVDS